MNWVATASRIVVATAVSGLIGWFYGHTSEAIILALALLILYSLYQMQRVQVWLNDPAKAPPDVPGIWGELVARVYLQQRKNHKIQKRLQSNVEYLENSFTSMRDGVVMVDELGAIKWFNEAVNPLLGLRYPDDTGQTLTNLIREPEFNSYFLAGDYSMPLQFVMTGERKAHLRVEITRFGEAERLLFVRDVSAAVRMEEIRRDFVANVSHELRTPLTVITGYLEAFRENVGAFPDRFVKPLKQMIQHSRRMETLLKDLLWLSQVENESRNGTFEAVDMRGLLNELREELKGAYPESDIVLDIETDAKIVGNYQELYSAVSNLAGNAIKYSEPGSPVSINWSQRGDKCALAVIDSGVGIDAVHIPRLTERFYRIDASRNSTTGGTGLGLAIVKHIAHAHDAQLHIESKLGEGSTFTLFFPLGG